MAGRPIRILLADDHAVVRRGFRLILDGQPGLQVVGEACNGREAVQLATALEPDIVILDVSMPDLNGIEAARRIAEEVPRARVLALSMHRDGVYVREMLRAGARGYLLKDADDEALSDPVQAVARGDAYISASVADTLLPD